MKQKQTHTPIPATIQEVALSTLIPNPSNPRFIKDHKFRKLVKSIRDFPAMMALRPIVVDENNVALGGNMRLAALKEIGYPMSGCQKISQGCKYCYAATLAEKYRGQKAFPNGFDLTIREHKLKEPFRLKVPTLIFANSMSDLFWDKVPDSYRHKIVDVIEQTPQHEYQVLTKRPEIMLAFSKQRTLPPNFWAGTTIEDDRVKERLHILRQVKAEIRFISAEPLIAPLTFQPGDLQGIHWMITGGESGTHLWDDQVCDKRALVRYDRNAKKWNIREDRADWVRHIRDACIAQGTKFFHKQWGGSYPEAAGRLLDGRFWSEIPRLPGQRTNIENEYLKLIESGNLKDSKKDQLLIKTVR